MKLFRFSAVIVIVFFYGLVYGQNIKDVSSIFKRVSAVEDRKGDFVKDAVYLELNSKLLNDFYRDGVESVKLELPISNEESIVLNLHQFEVFTDAFILTTSLGDTIKNYNQGRFFRGEISNNKGFATIAFFDNQVYGIISMEGVGNYNLGKLEGSRSKYIIYNDRDVNIDLGIACNTTIDYKIQTDRRSEDHIQNRVTCVNFYLEGDYALYQDKGSISNTADYMTSLFAEMATLYDNESINIEINEMMIWVSADGYDVNSSGNALDQFIANNPNKNADLCHLFALGGNSTGGLAYVDVLCVNSYKYAYSNISSTYNNVPTYSWSVECITHETGHNMGSNHTHDCIWGANGDAQIDDCGPEAGYSGSPGGCYDSNNPILPNKGTIMSYCHLLGSVGIDFNLGFGQEPGDLIRSKVSNAACLGDYTASSTCDIPVNVDTASVGSTTVDLIWEIGVGGSEWEIEYGISGFAIGAGTIISNITTTSKTLTGLTVGQVYDWYIRTDCGGGDFSSRVGPMSFETKCSAPGSFTLPYFQGWEGVNGTMLNNGPIYCDGFEKWDFETDQDGEGRVRFGTDANSNYTITGDGSLLMDMINTNPTTINYSTLTLNLNNYSSSDDLLFRFSLKEFGDENHPNDKVWVRGSISDAWIEAYDILPAGKANGTAYFIKKDLDSLLTANGQTVGSDFQIRLGQEDNSLFPNDGIMYDDIEVLDCGKNSIPYFTDFSGDIDCWTTEDIANDSYTWTKASGTSCDADYFGLEYSGSTSPSTPMDDWLHSPGFYLVAGTTYQLSFTVGDAGQTEKMKVFISNDNSSAVAVNGDLLFSDEGIDNADCYKSRIDYTPSSTGYYFVSFHGYSDANSVHNLYVDDFNIDIAPSLSEFSVEDNTNNTCETFTINGVSGTNWHHIYNGNSIIASINSNGQELGGVSVELRDGGAVESYTIEGQAAKTLPRYINFSSDNAFNNNVSIRNYILLSELNEYNNTAPGTSDAIEDLQINHYDGANENCDFSDNVGTGTIIQPISIMTGIVAASDYYMEFSVNSFSEFLTHEYVGATQPLSFDFKVVKLEETNLVQFYVYSDFGVKEYVIQRSSNRVNWEDINRINSKNKEGVEYSFRDNYLKPIAYYRLKAIKEDGLELFSKMVVIERGVEDLKIVSIYPNPNNGQFSIELNLNDSGNSIIEIYDILGRNIYSEKWLSHETRSIKSVDVKGLKSGLYFVKLKQKDAEVIEKVYIDFN